MELKSLMKDGKIIPRKLQELYQTAVEIEMGLRPFTIHPDEGPRLGASNSLCARKTVMEFLRGDLKKPFTMQTRRKLRVGDMFHDMADRGIDKVLWAFRGELFRIPPFRITAFPDIFEDVEGVAGVDGTPDHILYAPNLKLLVLVDQKSANDFGFRKNKKSASIYHSVQVATYLDGLRNSPIGQMVDLAQCNMCYMSKEAIEIGTPELTPTAHADARQYWTMVADCLKHEDYELPPALPREDWACRYCDYATSREACEKMKYITDLPPIAELEQSNG